jgi:hypothetical protein
LKSGIWLAIIVVAGGALRLLSPTRLSLWRDEAQYVAVASLPDPGAILSFLYHHESHPPLFYLLGYAGGKLSGSVEASVGALVLVASVLTIVAVYWLTASAFSRLGGLIASAGTAFSVPLVLHSVQARPYALLALLFVASTAGLWLFWSRRSRRGLIGWVLASLAALYTHHVAVLLMAGQVLIVAWMLVRRSFPEGGQRRDLVRASSVVALGWLPGAWLLVHQMATSGYPAQRPIEFDGPPRMFLHVAMGYPFELLLPMIVAAALCVVRFHRARLPRPSSARVVQPDARVLLLGAAPCFLLLTVIGTYRSQLLTPHVMLASVPLGMVLFGGHVASLVEHGHRWRAAIWLEVGVVLATLSLLFQIGYAESSVQPVAEGISAEAGSSDLLLLSPGVFGASFNRYFAGSNSQINFPYEGKVMMYPFDGDFDKLADPVRFRRALDSLYLARQSGRRVWLISDARWIRPYVSAPDELSRDSLGGLGQADRARANRFYRYLRWLYGPPVLTYATTTTGPGPEHAAAWLFAHPETGSDPAP